MAEGPGQAGRAGPAAAEWEADADSPRGPVHCLKSFNRLLIGKYVRLDARWVLPAGAYEELALFGVDVAGGVAFWSFTSDGRLRGKPSHGVLAPAADVHPEALAFEAQMPAGSAWQGLLAGRQTGAGSGGLWSLRRRRGGTGLCCNGIGR